MSEIRLLTLICYACGKEIYAEAVLASGRDSSDRPFAMHLKCSKAILDAAKLMVEIL